MDKQNDDVTRKTLDLNFDVNFFNKRLKSHMNVRTVDIQLLEQLQKTTELISQLMSDCILIDVDSFDVQNSDVLQLHRQLYCSACNCAIQVDSGRIKTHLNGNSHLRCLAKAAKKEQKGNKNSGNATQIVTKTENNSGTKTGEVVEESVKQQKPPEPKPKLSKKVQAFIRDRNLEKLSRTLTDEGERIKLSSKHNAVIDSIQKALVSKYPNVKVYPFGSRVSGLCGHNSDLDLYIDLNNQYYNNPGHISSSEFKQIEQLLKKTKEWIEFFSITGARTPILQAFYRIENLPCDLSFSNGLSHCNTKLINYYIGIQPIFVQIAHIVKEWANAADMKMNSYALTLLLVFYFQLAELLPTVHQLQKNKNGNEKPIGYWNAHIETIDWPKKSNDFRKHLIGFFSYYSTFNFDTMIVCPYLGKPLEKARFEHGKESLPQEFQSYMDYMKKIDLRNADELTDLFAYEKPMVVQDPFELIHNVAKGVRPTSCERFVTFCKLTAEALKNKRVL